MLFIMPVHIGKTGMRWIQRFEGLLRNAGMLLVALFIVATIHRVVLSHAELRGFKFRQTVLAATSQQITPSAGIPNFSLWSEQRIRSYQDSLAARLAPAMGILHIAKIQVEAPILEGTDALSLNRGVGHVASTASPGSDGNVAIAGHRDGFFRSLKDISLGDAIDLETLHKTQTYIVDRIIVVDPSDVSVLRPRAQSSLTLITCYPFYYIGGAPKRYIVQASLIDPALSNHPARIEVESSAASGKSALVAR